MTQRLSFLAAVLCVAAIQLPAEESPAAGTLPEDFLPQLRPILAGAIDRAPAAISSSIDLAQAEAARYQRAAGLWPSLSGNFSYAVNTESSSGGKPTTSRGPYYGISANQAVFEWGALKFGNEIGKLGVKVAERNFAEVYRGLAVTIREQYLALILKQANLRNARYGLKLSQEGFEVAKANKEAGAISDAEFLNYRLVNEDTQLVADRAAEDFHYAKRTFMRLAGLDQLADESIPTEVPAVKYSADLADAMLQHFMGGGVESTFQNEIYMMQIHESDLSYRIARTNLLPKFTASAGYSVSDQTTLLTNAVTQQYSLRQLGYSIGGSWTIFDGFATRGAKLAALASKRSSERLRQTYVDTTVDTATYLRDALGLSSRTVELSEVRANLIKVDVDKVEGDLKLGMKSPAAVENATFTFYKSEYVRSSNRADYFDHWCDYVSLLDMDPALANLPKRYVR